MAAADETSTVESTPIGSIREIREFVRTPRPPTRVLVEARLVFSTPNWLRFRVEQRGFSIWCYASTEARPSILDGRLGDLMQLSGTTGDAGVYLRVDEAKVLSRGSRRDIAFASQTQDESLLLNRCVEFNGTVAETLFQVQETQLILNEFDQTVTARLFSQTLGEQHDPYGGHKVRLFGFIEHHAARSTPTRRCAQILLMSEDQLEFGDPDSAERRSDESVTSHVDAIDDGVVFAGGLRVGTLFAYALEPGKLYTFDLTDVDADQRTAQSIAIFESTTAIEPPTTPVKSADRIDVQQMLYQRVTTAGEITNIETSDSKLWLHLESNDVPFVAVLDFDPAKDSLEEFVPGTRYRLSGVLDDLPAESDDNAFLVRIGRPSDVQPETLHFVTREQVQWLATGGLVFLGLIVGWQFSLRQQVKRKTRKLRSLNAQILAAVRAVQDGILVFDQQRRVCLTDQKLVHLLRGVEVELGTHADDVLDQHLLPQFDPVGFRSFWSEIQDKPFATQESEFETKQRKGWMRVATTPVMDDQGQVLGRIWTFRDITAQRKLQNETLQSQKLHAIGRLTGGIAHDFNNLLHVINSSLELIETDTVDENVHENVVVARLAAGRAAGLTSQLLTFARKSNFETTCVNVHQTIQQVAEFLQRTVGANVSLTLDLDDALWAAEANDSQLEQILINLCVNARDAIGDDLGEIRIQACNVADSPIGDAIKIVVHDNGMGMCAETISNAFDPFFTTKEVGKGTGLGLTLVHGAITKIGGTISLQSELNEGTSVEVLLQRSESSFEAPASGDRTIRVAQEGLPLEIMLVDDDDLVRRTGEKLIRAVGQNVRSVAGGREALEVVRAKNPVDLVILDLTMPEMTGRETLIELRKIRPELPIVICSGYSDESSSFQDEAPIYRPNAFLRKPFHLREFSELLTQFKR